MEFFLITSLNIKLLKLALIQIMCNLFHNKRNYFFLTYNVEDDINITTKKGLPPPIGGSNPSPLNMAVDLYRYLLAGR